MKKEGTPSLETRIRYIEDMLAIYQLISAYGPAVDSGSLKEAAELWTEDGVYDIPGIGTFLGRTGIVEMLEGPLHQSLIHGGSAHILSQPHVTISGDKAVATHYGRVYTPKENSFGLFRVIATRWELVRTENDWKCERRINCLLDGRAESRALLAQGIAESFATADKPA